MAYVSNFSRTNRHRTSYARKGFDKSNLELIGDFGHPGLEVVLEEILEFTGELDTSRATTDDNHVQKTLALLGALVLESGSFTAVHDTLTDTLSISNLLQEARVLADTRNTLKTMSALPLDLVSQHGHTESSVLSADTDDEHIEMDLSGRSSTLDLGVVVDVNDLLFVVNLCGFGFVELDGGFLVAEEVANRLHDGAVLDGTGCARGQERSEQEVVARRDDDDVVVFGVELLEKGDGTPTGTWSLLSAQSSMLPNGTLSKHIPRMTRVFLVGSGSAWSPGFFIS